MTLKVSCLMINFFIFIIAYTHIIHRLSIFYKHIIINKFTVSCAIVDNFPQCNMLISLYFKLGELNGDNLVSLMMIKSELGGDNPQAKVSWVMIKSELGGDKKMLVDIIDAMFSTPISSL